MLAAPGDYLVPVLILSSRAGIFKYISGICTLDLLLMKKGEFIILMLWLLPCLAPAQTKEVDHISGTQDIDITSFDPWKGRSQELPPELFNQPLKADSILLLAKNYDSLHEYTKAGKAYILRAVIAEREADFRDLPDYYRLAAGAFAKSRESRGEAYCFFRLGFLQRNVFDDNAKALQYHTRYFELSSKIKDSLNMARGLQNIANIERDLGRLKEADEKYHTSILIAESLYKNVMMLPDSSPRAEIINRVADIHHDMGEWCQKTKDYSGALRHFSESIKISHGDAYGQNTRAQSLEQTAQVYFALKDYSQSLLFANKANDLARSLGMWSTVGDATQCMYNVYLAMGNYPKALESYRQFHESREKIRTRELERQTNQLRVRYELEEKESALAMLEAEKEAVEFKRNAFAGGLALTFVIALLIYSRQRTKIRAEEKEILLRTEQLDIYTRNLLEKNQLVEKLKTEMSELQASKGTQSADLETLHQVLNSTLLTDQDWEEFKQLFDQVHHGFFARLKLQLPDLSLAEIRLVALLKLKLGTKEVANMLAISPESVNKSRYRLRKKLGLDHEDELEAFIFKL